MRRGLGGILTGDVIVAIDGRPVKRANDLANALDDAKVGDRATLRILRSDKTVRAARSTSLLIFEGLQLLMPVLRLRGYCYDSSEEAPQN